MVDTRKVNVKIEGDIAAESVDHLKEELIRSMDMMDLLLTLTRAYDRKYENAHAAPAKDQQRWTELIDLMAHFDDAAPLTGDPMPENNPLTLIRRLKKEGLVSSEEGKTLKNVFHEKVGVFMQRPQTEATVQNLYQGLQNFSIGEELKAIRNTPNP